MTAAENVEKFLRASDPVRVSDHISSIGGVDLDYEDVASLLDEVVALREHLEDRIVEVERTDTVVHLQNPPIDYGLPAGSVVRFATGPDENDYVQVHCDGEWVRIIGFPELDVRPYGLGNCIRIRSVQR